jgi:hypothetical protein
MAKLLEPGDELGLPWDDWADGRIWRLTKGRHFLSTSSAAEEAAENAAARMGKIVRAQTEVRFSKIYIWVQFADHQIDEGDPCPCGGTDLHRVNPALAVCAACGALLLVNRVKREKAEEETILPGKGDELLELLLGRPPGRIVEPEGKGKGRRAERGKPAAADAAPTGPARRAARKAERKVERGGGRSRNGDAPFEATTLERFSSVRLRRFESNATHDRYWGYGIDEDGAVTPLLVSMPLVDGEPVAEPDLPLGFVHEALLLPAGAFADGLDADEGWDVVVENGE